MRIEVKGDFKNLTKNVEKKDDDFGNFLLDVAHKLNASISLRVQNEGRGSNGRKMKYNNKIYSERYGRKRERSGRRADIRTLNYSGNMWQALTAEKKSEKEVEMFFGGVEDAEKAFYNDQRTPFFDLSTRERSLLKKELEGFIKLWVHYKKS